MHSWHYKQRNESYGRKPSTTYVNMHHNGDFSGDVIVQVGTLEDGESELNIYFRDVEVPFQALKELVGIYVLQRETEKLENMSIDELVRKVNDE